MENEEEREKRFFLIQSWLLIFDEEVDAKKLLEECKTLQEVGQRKLVLVFLLAQHIEIEVTPKRICEVIKINIEDLLLLFLEDLKCDFASLTKKVRTTQKIDGSLENKQQKIVAKSSKLPKEVFEYYSEYFL
ncbi:MAG: hypothetical protein ABFQ53_01785 [Patescibacteria group bacterium]